MALEAGQNRPGEWKEMGRTAIVMWKRENKECLDFVPGIGMTVGAKTFSSTYGFFVSISFACVALFSSPKTDVTAVKY